MKFIIKNILFLFNMVFVLGLALAYLSPYTDPNIFWFVGFFGLTFKLWVIANLGLVFFWLILGRRLWIYNALILVAGYSFILRDVQFNATSEEEGVFNLMFFNTRVLQVYNEGNTSVQVNQFLKDNDLDVAVFVEWLNKKGKVDESAYPYQQFVRLESGRNIYDYGLMLASKHKILHWERVDYGHKSDNMTAWFDLEVNDEVIRLIATHLQSNSLGAGDYHKFLNIEFDEQYTDHAKNTAVRIRRSMKRRAIQTQKISEIVENSPYPVIIMGDFNDTPQSYAYQQLRNGRKDAFIEKGSGVGTTYLEPFPLLRIDFILFDDFFQCKSYTSSTEIRSDHKMISASFDFP